MVHEARGENLQAADAYRKAAAFIRAHPDHYDPGYEEVFDRLVAKLDPSAPNPSASPPTVLSGPEMTTQGEGRRPPPINYRDQQAGGAASICSRRLMSTEPSARRGGAPWRTPP
jgi:hypothetical protein